MLNPRDSFFEEKSPFQAPFEAPLVRVALALGLGVWLGDELRGSTTALLVYVVLSAVAAAAGLWMQQKATSRFILAASLGMAAILCLGIALGLSARLKTEYKTTILEAVSESSDLQQATHTSYTIRLPQGRRFAQNRVTASLESLDNIQVYAYFPRLDSSAIPPGSRLVVTGKLQVIQPPKNPYQFDNQAYARHRGITHRLQVTDYEAIGQTHDFYSRLALWQQNAVKNLLTTIKNERVRQILPALTLGLQGEINEETYGWYSKTGAVHVLSVSGFHVALLAGIIGWLLSLLKDKRPLARWSSLVIALLLIWLYTGVTGSAPATVRSAWMLSLLAFSQTLRRGSNGFNTLAGAVVLQLVIAPGILWDIGFQLSVSAVVGMLLLSSPLSNLIAVPKILQSVKEATLVGVAAQIGALLPALVHFGRLPVWFLPASLPVGVLGNIGLVFGLLASVGSTGPLGWFGQACGFIAEYALKALHAWLESWANLPGSVLDFGPVLVWEATLWLVAIGFIVHGLLHPKRLLLAGIGAVMVSCLSLWQWEIRPNSERREWTVYAAGRQALALHWKTDGATLYAAKGLDNKRIAMLAGNHLRLLPFAPRQIDTVWVERGQIPAGLPPDAPWPNETEKAWQSAR